MTKDFLPCIFRIKLIILLPKFMHGFKVNHISKVGTVSGSTANFPTLTEEEEEDAGDGPNNTTMAAPRTPHGSVLG